MDSPPPRRILDPIPVPEIFHSWYDKGPFRTCMICSRELLVDGVEYVVERAFVKDEPVYEFALCEQCQEGLFDELSKESVQRLVAHFEERLDLLVRQLRMLQETDRDVEEWVDACLLTGKKRSDCRTYAIYAHCDGPNLLMFHFPYMISDRAMQDLEKLLSKKTRDRLDDFIDEYLGLPPEFKDLPLVFV